MAIEKTVSEIAEILGVSRQAVNNRVKSLPEEDVSKNEKGVTVVNRSGLIKLEEIYKKTIFKITRWANHNNILFSNSICNCHCRHDENYKKTKHL